MPLADVLSALREIILDDCALVPELDEERRSSFSKRFPKLSCLELEDLVAISPKRLAIYTRTIFSGEANMLLKHLPVSIEVISESWQGIYGEKFSAYELLKSVHRTAPWKSSNVEDLVESLKFYIEQDRRILGEYRFLPNLIEFELGILKSRRSKDDELSSKVCYESSDFRNLSIGEVLDMSFFKPLSVQTLRLEWNLNSYAKFFFTEGRLLESIPRQIDSFNVIARNSEHRVAFLEIPEYFWNYFSGLQSSCLVDMRGMAEEFHEKSQLKERESLNIFASLLSSLVDVGAIKVFASRG